MPDFVAEALFEMLCDFDWQREWLFDAPGCFDSERLKLRLLLPLASPEALIERLPEREGAKLPDTEISILTLRLREGSSEWLRLLLTDRSRLFSGLADSLIDTLRDRLWLKH